MKSYTFGTPLSHDVFFSFLSEVPVTDYRVRMGVMREAQSLLSVLLSVYHICLLESSRKWEFQPLRPYPSQDRNITKAYIGFRLLASSIHSPFSGAQPRFRGMLGYIHTDQPMVGVKYWLQIYGAKISPQS